jgi:hypothetical protein
MGLPNIREHADDMQLSSTVGEGVQMELTFLRGKPSDD